MANMILDDKSIYNRLNYFSTPDEFGYVDYPMTETQKTQIANTFKRLMNEDINKNLTLQRQFTLLDNTMEEILGGSKPSTAFQRYGDNRHMSYFDAWLYDGASQDILDVLNSYGLNSNELLGVRLKDLDLHTSSDVSVYQHVIQTPDNSIEVEYFDIYYKGKLIYHYGNEDGISITPYQPDKPIKQPNTKSTYKGTIIYGSGEGIVIKEWVDKNGRTFYTDIKTGRRVNPYKIRY